MLLRISDKLTFTKLLCKSPTFGYSYSTRNILLSFCAKALHLVIPTVLEIFYQGLVQKAYFWLFLQYYLEIFYQGFVQKPYFWLSLQYQKYLPRLCAKALLLVIPIVQEIFYQAFVQKPYFWLFLQCWKYSNKNLCRKTLFLVVPTALEIFYQDL